MQVSRVRNGVKQNYELKTRDIYYDIRRHYRFNSNDYNAFLNKCKENNEKSSVVIRRFMDNYVKGKENNDEKIDLILTNLVEIFDVPCNIGYDDYMVTLYPKHCEKCDDDIETKKKCWEKFLLNYGKTKGVDYE